MIIFVVPAGETVWSIGRKGNSSRDVKNIDNNKNLLSIFSSTKDCNRKKFTIGINPIYGTEIPKYILIRKCEAKRNIEIDRSGFLCINCNINNSKVQKTNNMNS